MVTLALRERVAEGRVREVPSASTSHEAATLAPKRSN